MERKFIISCESTVDLPYAKMLKRDVPVLFYTYTVDDVEYEDNMGRSSEAQKLFYSQIKQGKLPHTSQINEMRYYDFLKEISTDADVLHIAFGTGMTPSFYAAERAAENLKTEFPDRRIIVIDSLCSCTGYGMLVECALDMKDEGKSMDEIAAWVTENRLRMHHQFFSTDLTLFKKSGRVSGPVALVGSMLGVCPVMHLNVEGKIIAYDRALGKKKAISKTVSAVLENIDGGKGAEGKIYISHSNAPELAEATRVAFAGALANGGENIEIAEIGTIIASHCGPGTVAVFYFGKERTSLT